MNRSDILKKCVDRGVAGETECGAVSHLFYVYLLSALQRGQRVEVPNFGTFGTRVAGVKRTRKIPYFEPEQELGRKVNQRFENLRSLVTGKYVVTPQAGDTEYGGPQAPYDETVERGKEFIFDTSREVTLDEYERAAASRTEETQPEEEHIMPRLNLRDEEEGTGIPPEPPEESPITPPPTLREVGPDGEKKAPWLAIVVILLVLSPCHSSLGKESAEGRRADSRAHARRAGNLRRANDHTTGRWPGRDPAAVSETRQGKGIRSEAFG
jgi:hypothetical protein